MVQLACPPNTAYRVGVGRGRGARTGLASVVTGLLFLLSIFAAPLVSIIPSEGRCSGARPRRFLMMQQVRGIDWDDLEIAIPAFLTIV